MMDALYIYAEENMNCKSQSILGIFVCLIMVSCTPGKVLGPTNLPLPTSSATPISTNTPNPTFTPTPTLSLPVEISTPLPIGMQQITAKNVTTLRQVAYWGSPLISVLAFKLSPDKKRAFLDTTGGLVVYDLATQEILLSNQLVIGCTSYPDRCLSISASGERFAIITDEVEVWDITQGLVFKFPVQARGSNDVFLSVEISPNGEMLAVRDFENQNNTWPPTVNLYNIETTQVLTEQINPAYSLDGYDGFYFSPDGAYFISVGFYSAILRTTDWSKVRDISYKSNQITGISPNGELMYFRDDNLVAFYQTVDGKLVRQISAPLLYASVESEIIFSSDGKVVGVNEDDNIGVWEISSGDLLGRYPLLDKPWILVNNMPSQVQIPDLISELLNITPDTGFDAWTIKMSYLEEENRVKMVQMWAGYKGQWNYFYRACSIGLGEPSSCQDSSDPIFLHSDGVFYQVQAASAYARFEIVPAFGITGPSLGMLGRLETLEWVSPDNRFSLVEYGSLDSSGTEVWDLGSGNLLKSWPGYIQNFDVSPDGHILAMMLLETCGYTICGQNMVVYDLDTNRTLLNQILTDNGELGELKFFPTGELLYSIRKWQSGENLDQFYVYDPTTNESITLDLSLKYASYSDLSLTPSIAFSPDGQLLAIGLHDRTIHVYDTQTYEEIFSWKAGGADVLEFLSGGRLLISASMDGFTQIWGIEP